MRAEFTERLLLAISDNPTLSVFCRRLVTDILEFEGCVSAAISCVDETGGLRIIGQHGFSENHAIHSADGQWSNVGIAVAVSSGSASNFRLEYPKTRASQKMIPEDREFGVVCSPIWSQGQTVGALQLVFNRFPNKHIVSYGYLQLLCTALESILAKAVEASAHS